MNFYDHKTYDPPQSEEWIQNEKETLFVNGEEVRATFDLEFAKDTFSKINTLRKERNLSPLKWDNRLEIFAKKRAIEASIRWSHIRPNGLPWNTIEEQPDEEKAMIHGENLGKGYKSASALFLGWENSKTHYDNLVRDSFQGAYLAVYKTDSGKTYSCILFSYSDAE